MAEQNDAISKLTPQRQNLVKMVLDNLEKGDSLWLPGWKMPSAPESGITGKKYHGVNNLYLTFAAMAKGYTDNRWLTYKQMVAKGWEFKTDEEGKSLGKGASVSVEYFELRDKETKKPFDRHVLDGMTLDEKQEYMKENIYPIRKYYNVFNGDVIKGIPEQEKHEHDPNGVNERAENILTLWNDTEAKIIHGGMNAYYSVKADEIHVPNKDQFFNMQEYYATVLHELGHSTGHEKRLNRQITNGFGTPAYAQEELRAEIASLFLEQDLEINVSDKHIENNSKYIKNWQAEIQDNPNALFLAIADADKIAKYVAAKEKESKKKKIEHFAIATEENEYGREMYRVYMIAAHAQMKLLLVNE